MNTPYDSREPEEIERDLNRARAQVSATIDAIQQRMTPGELMDQAYHYLRHSAPADFGANLGQTVRHNPVPVTLIGVGIAWLMAQGRHGAADAAYARARAEAAEDGWDVSYGRPVDAAETGTTDGIGRKVKDGAAHARDAAHHARERWADGVHRARARAGDLGERSRERIDRVRGAVSGMLDEQPLVLGALGLALGAALGAALPGTRREDELMGERRDDLLERTRRTAHDKAEVVADSVGDALRQTAPRSDDARARAADEWRGDYPNRPRVDETGPGVAGSSAAGSSRRMEGLL